MRQFFLIYNQNKKTNVCLSVNYFSCRQRCFGVVYQIEALEAGVELGVSFSVNTHEGETSRVLRDAGGIFGSNDFSKIPVLTLK